YTLEARSMFDELDDSLHTQANNVTRVAQARAALSPRARERVIPQPSSFSGPTFFVQVISPDGIIVDRSATLASIVLPVNSATLERAGLGVDVLETVLLDRQQVRLFTAPMLSDDEFLGYVQVGRSLQVPQDALATLRTTLLGAG